MLYISFNVPYLTVYKMDGDTTAAGAAPALLPHQISHVERVDDILSRYRFSLDTSKMGLGKTYIACKIAQRRGLKLVVVCPTTLQSKWQNVSTEWGVDIITMSYHALRGREDGPTAGGYLQRCDKEFTATDMFTKLVDEGILLVADEAQSLKNTSSQARAFSALCLPIKQADAINSRILLLSATPFDKQEHVMNILLFALVKKSPSMYIYNKTAFGTGVIVLTGANELIDACLLVDQAATRHIISREIVRAAKHVHKLVYQLFLNVLQNRVCAYMVGDEANRIPPPIVKTTFYRIDGVILEDYRKGVSDLNKSVIAMQEPGNVPDWGGIGKALQIIEYAKREVIVRTAKRILMGNSSAKVVIGLNYLCTIAWVKEAIGMESVVLTGSVPPKNRAELINKFQAPDTKCRVMIGNMSVMEVGIDLDDKEGSFPRTCLYSPHYRATGLHQAIGRVHRVNSASQAKVHIMYGPIMYAEKSVLNVLARKTEVLKETLPGQVASGTIFPGDYNCEQEECMGTFVQMKSGNAPVQDIKKKMRRLSLDDSTLASKRPALETPVADVAMLTLMDLSIIPLDDLTPNSTDSSAAILQLMTSIRSNWKKFGGSGHDHSSIRAFAISIAEKCRGRKNLVERICTTIQTSNKLMQSLMCISI
jgi:hypothetical protein